MRLRFNKTLIPIREDWNLMGEELCPIPIWFRVQLRSLDPQWTLQYIPPDWVHDDGVNENIYPYGVWDICYRLPKSRLLHPKAVYSLADSEGNLCPPGPDIIRLLRIARYMTLRGEQEALRKMMDNAILDYRRSRVGTSREEMHGSLQKFCSVNFDRQWQNRVYLRTEITK